MGFASGLGRCYIKVQKMMIKLFRITSADRFHGFMVLFFIKITMAKKFKIGDHVALNSEAGRVSGAIIKVHTKDFNYKGYTHDATEDDQQYEIKSDKTNHIAAYKNSALKKVK